MIGSYEQVEYAVKRESALLLKKAKFTDFLNEHGCFEMFTETNIDSGIAFYKSHILGSQECFVIYEIYPNRSNMCKVVFFYEVHNTKSILKFINTLNNNDMFAKYSLTHKNMIEVSIRYSASLSEFKPTMFQKLMNMCLSCAESSINHILINDKI